MYENTSTFEENFSFWRNLTLPVIFFLLTPIALAVSLYSLISLRNHDTAVKTLTRTRISFTEVPTSGVKVFASLPSSFPAIDGVAEVADARPEIIRGYLDSYKSELSPFSETLVEMADKYSLDWRLLTAIAQKESGLCNVIPPGGHNCWGWGIHSEGTLGFDSYPEAIETVSKGIKEEYVDKGYTTPDLMMQKYAPLSNGTWAEGVNYYMSLLE